MLYLLFLVYFVKSMLLIKFKPSQHKLLSYIMFNSIYSSGFLFHLEKLLKRV